MAIFEFMCEPFHCTQFSPSQNGYPSRRRSLVDDARFESAVVKQTKQAVLEEARLQANGESHVTCNAREGN